MLCPKHQKPQSRRVLARSQKNGEQYTIHTQAKNFNHLEIRAALRTSHFTLVGDEKGLLMHHDSNWTKPQIHKDVEH
jgi:hypothetical protein